VNWVGIGQGGLSLLSHCETEIHDYATLKGYRVNARSAATEAKPMIGSRSAEGEPSQSR